MSIAALNALYQTHEWYSVAKAMKENLEWNWLEKFCGEE
jgi:hypothetical protein